MNICVFGAGSDSIDEVYIKKAEELGEALGKRGHALVFGGGATGMMGAAARGFKRGGGKILSVIPKFFDDKRGDGALYDQADQVIWTDTMRERKQQLEDHCDAFIVLPGGIGTYDEFFENLVLKLFGFQDKPLVVYNINGYYDKLKELFDHGVEQGFIKEHSSKLYTMFDNPDELLIYLEICHQL